VIGIRWLAVTVARLVRCLCPSAAEQALQRPIELPGGTYPDHYSPPLDLLDVQLDELRNRLWPDEEWRHVIACPTPELTGYSSPQQARANTTRGGAHPRRCPCGRWHLQYLFRRRQRPRRPPSVRAPGSTPHTTRGE
jgi:hypothetical protein